MTVDNLSFSLEIDFIPDLEEGRADFKKRMKEVAAKHDCTFTLDKKFRPVISGLSKDDVEKILSEIGLSAFGSWPSCILTCTINSPLPMYSVGMSDGWDIYTGAKTFFAFAQFPTDAVQIILKACTYYLEHENYQTMDEFIAETGYDKFRDIVLETESDIPVSSGSSSTNSYLDPNLPTLSPGDFIRPEHNIMQVIEVYPDMGPFLLEYGMSCVGCFVSYDENVWQAAQAHGLDVFEILGEMNEFIADKYNKPLLTENTPMEEILTLYPQLLSIFRSYKIDMPSDIQTPIGKLCEKSGVNLKKLIEECDERLRNGSEF